ncbi:MAG: GNAT family N-acetyltransferase [Bacteroidia bacterium]
MDCLLNTYETTHLQLRKLRASDSDVLFALYADARVMAWRGLPVHTSREETELLQFSWRKQEAEGTGMRFGIVLRETNVLIGTAGLKQISTQHRSAEIGYELVPEHWNEGIMTEALRPVLAHAFDVLQLHTVSANIDPEHSASRRVLEKLGFVQEGLFYENYFFERWWNSAIWVCRQKPENSSNNIEC